LLPEFPRRLDPIADHSVASLGAFVAANVGAGATRKTDGWPAYPGIAGVKHDCRVVGTMAAHLVLSWTHRVFANLERGALGAYHGLRRNRLQSCCLDEFVLMLRIACGHRFSRCRTRHTAFRTLPGIGARTKPVTGKKVDHPGSSGISLHAKRI